MFPAMDVLDLESYPIVPLMEKAVLAESLGTVPNLPAQGCWNVLTHADAAASRARAFTRDMM